MIKALLATTIVLVSLTVQAQNQTSIVKQATALIDSMTERQQSLAIVDPSDPRRFAWHYYPEDIRELQLEGLPLNAMSTTQRQRSLELISQLLSPEGMRRVYHVFALEKLLLKLDDSGIIRDPYKYHLSFYGIPGANSEWGLGLEGHHLSLNFVFHGDRLISVLPLAFGANPETVYPEIATQKLPSGTRLLKSEESAAFALFDSLSEKQYAQALVSSSADVDPRDVGTRCLLAPLAAGLVYSEMSANQRALALNLIQAHAEVLAPNAAAAFLGAWASDPQSMRIWVKGQPGENSNYSYGIENDQYSIEMAMSQEAIDRRASNHVHLVIRSIAADFGGCRQPL